MRQGESRAAIGQHASIIDTSELMAVNPRGVDLGRLAGLRLSRQPTGIVGDPARASAERGRELLELRIRAAVQQIRSAMAKP
jgi:creatinine amidohydrolase/Fe(II)-dependent formamide hydrolase-like protein